MSWYDGFNAVEAALWGVVAAALGWRARGESGRRRGALIVGAFAFLAFGVTDLCELGRAGRLPLWLWGAKVACGTAILAARFTWRGWQTFRLTDREVLFGLFCLTGVAASIILQRALP